MSLFMWQGYIIIVRSRSWEHIFADTVAARYWDDPTAFKPSRFLGDWPRDAFMPFSAGTSLFYVLSLTQIEARQARGDVWAGSMYFRT